MLNELRFVQGSIAKKDLLPALTHFRIEGETVRGYNGTIALCTPIPFDFDCTPKATPLIKAIQNCNETVQLNMTKAGRLSIKSGDFKAFIECVEGDETPHVLPEGEEFELDGEALLAAMEKVAPFVSNDASRPWSTGVLLHNQSAFATNNVCLVECWVRSQFPFTCNIPLAAVTEMLRIKEPPTHAQANKTSMTFHYSGGRWLRTGLYQIDWPDVFKILDRDSDAVELPEGFFEALDGLKPFTNDLGAVYFEPGVITTSLTEGDGASYAINVPAPSSCYNIEMLKLLQGTADTVDFTTYPGPCMFFGEGIRGAIIGMKTHGT